VGDMLSRRFPLAEHREMIEGNSNKNADRAMKTAFSF